MSVLVGDARIEPEHRFINASNDGLPGTTPLIMEDYFLGKTTAYGVFEDRFGTVRRQFRANLNGTFDGGALTLVEDFLYNDGEEAQRIWKIYPQGNGKYRATANDMAGEAKGEAVGNRFHWTYKIDLAMLGTIWRCGFDDWMHLQSDGVLINRATVTRFGIRIGQVIISFRKPV